MAVRMSIFIKLVIRYYRSILAYGFFDVGNIAPMDFWATLEHQLRYKKGIEEMPGYDEISEELLHSARAIIEADNEMQRIKDKIGMFHEI